MRNITKNSCKEVVMSGDFILFLIPGHAMVHSAMCIVVGRIVVSKDFAPAVSVLS